MPTACLSPSGAEWAVPGADGDQAYFKVRCGGNGLPRVPVAMQSEVRSPTSPKTNPDHVVKEGPLPGDGGFAQGAAQCCFSGQPNVALQKPPMLRLKLPHVAVYGDETAPPVLARCLKFEEYPPRFIFWPHVPFIASALRSL